MQSLERTHQLEQAEPSSHQKSWRLRVAFGRLEYSTGRYIQPNRAGYTTGAFIATPQEEAAKGKEKSNKSTTN